MEKYLLAPLTLEALVMARNRQHIPGHKDFSLSAQSASGGLASIGPTNPAPAVGVFTTSSSTYSVQALTTAGNYSCAPQTPSAAKRYFS